MSAGGRARTDSELYACFCTQLRRMVAVVASTASTLRRGKVASLHSGGSRYEQRRQAACFSRYLSKKLSSGIQCCSSFCRGRQVELSAASVPSESCRS